MALASDVRRQLGTPARVTVRGTGGPHEFRVVGEAIYPTIEDPVAIGNGAVFTLDGLEQLGMTEIQENDPGFRQVLVRFHDGVDARAVAQDLMARGTDSPNTDAPSFPVPPTEVSQLTQVRALPRVLAGFLAAVAILGVAHALIQTVRRRQVELAVLRSIGFTRGQVARTIAWQAVALAAAGTVVGLPLGIAAGRWTWALVAGSIGVGSDARTPPVAFVAAAVGVALAGIVGSAFGRAAARQRPALALHTE